MPGHMVVGRGNGAGPCTGGYLEWNFGPFNLAASQTAAVKLAFAAPCDLRLQRITWNFRQVAAGAVDTVAFWKNSTPVVSGATSLTSGSPPFDLDYLATSWSAPAGETTASSGTTLNTAAGARDISQGQYILMSYTTDANVDGTTSNNVDDMCVSFLFTMAGHVATDAERD